jgi:hypothetical protein
MKQVHITREACRYSGRYRSNGSALVVILWVIGLLSLMVGSLAFDAHVEARITSYYRKRTKAERLMKSGLEIAELVIAKSAGIRPHTDAEPEDEGDLWFEDAKRLVEGDSVTLTEELGGGTIRLTIASERARRNVNLLTKEEEWESILEVGDVPEDMWPELVESFLDWIDKDDKQRADGAETEYYEELDPPYKAQNGPLFTVDELLLVKGFNRTILYGGTIEPPSGRGEPIIISGIADLLTTFGDRKVNVNSASPRVLMSLPDRTGDIDLIVDAIEFERQGEVDADGNAIPAFFESEADMFRRVPELGRAQLKPYVATTSSRYFRVTSIGEMQGVEKKVWSIVRYDGKNMTILQWREEE